VQYPILSLLQARLEALFETPTDEKLKGSGVRTADQKSPRLFSATVSSPPAGGQLRVPYRIKEYHQKIFRVFAPEYKGEQKAGSGQVQ
jgi:hypothetical protein